MKSLADQLLAVHHRHEFETDLARLIETRIAAVSGVKGFAFKTALRGIQRNFPDAIARAVHHLSPQIVAALEPLHREFREQTGGDFSLFLRTHSSRMTTALMQVTDARVERSSSATLKSFYGNFRGFAEKEIGAGMPDLAKLIRNYLD